MKLLGLCGLAGAGKDFTYDYIQSRKSTIPKVRRIAFADGVREEVGKAFMLTGSQKAAVFLKPYSQGIRFVLQQWGTEFRRAQQEDYWVEYGMKKAEQLDGLYGDDILIVFTDVRFENEALAIQARGGRVLEVKSDIPTRLERLGGALPPAHASEVIDFETDGVILNALNGSPPMIMGPDKIWLGMIS